MNFQTLICESPIPVLVQNIITVTIKQHKKEAEVFIRKQNVITESRSRRKSWLQSHVYVDTVLTQGMKSLQQQRKKKKQKLVHISPRAAVTTCKCTFLTCTAMQGMGPYLPAHKSCEHEKELPVTTQYS